MKGRKRVTLRTLAVETGLHPSTVSRILRGERDRSSEETRDRVLEVAKRRGYYPDFAARSLRSRKSFAIGFIVPDIRNIVYVNIYTGAAAATRRHDYHMLLSPLTTELPNWKEHFDFLTQRGVDGMLIATARIQDPALDHLEQAVPYVLVNRRAGGRVPYVVSNDETGGQLVTQHLIELGHHNIAFVRGALGVSTTEGRLAGYRSALENAGIPVNERLIVGDSYDTMRTARTIRLLLNTREPFTAVVVSDDMMATAVCHVLEENGLRVPDDVSVTGYNNLPIASLMSPTLTTVDNDLERMGKRAAELLIRRLSGRGPCKSATLTPKLIVRESSAPPP